MLVFTHTILYIEIIKRGYWNDGVPVKLSWSWLLSWPQGKVWPGLFWFDYFHLCKHPFTIEISSSIVVTNGHPLLSYVDELQ